MQYFLAHITYSKRYVAMEICFTTMTENAKKILQQKYRKKPITITFLHYLHIKLRIGEYMLRMLIPSKLPQAVDYKNVFRVIAITTKYYVLEWPDYL